MAEGPGQGWGGLAAPDAPPNPPRRILKCSPPFPPRIGPVAQDLLQRLLCKDPKKRLGAGPQGAQEVKNHPFFQVRLPAHPHTSLHTLGPGLWLWAGGCWGGGGLRLDNFTCFRKFTKESWLVFSSISIETWKMFSGERILGSLPGRADSSVLLLDRFREAR